MTFGLPHLHPNGVAVLMLPVGYRLISRVLTRCVEGAKIIFWDARLGVRAYRLCVLAGVGLSGKGESRFSGREEWACRHTRAVAVAWFLTLGLAMGKGVAAYTG